MGQAAAAITYRSEFGIGWVAFEGATILELGLPGSHMPYPEATTAPAAVTALAHSIEAYWAGEPLPRPSNEMMQAATRTALTGEIYRCVVAIPGGETMTYAEVASAIGRPGAARAVGAAMAANRFAPMIPCHRVVGSDGSLRGYAGGVSVKRHLIEMEAGAASG